MVYTHVMNDTKRTPWPLALAARCLNMQNGRIERFPEPGGAMEQNEFLLTMMRIAWRIWFIIDFMPANGLSPNKDDTELLAWASGKEGQR